MRLFGWRVSAIMGNKLLPEWLIEILQILQRNGVQVKFFRMYRDGQDEVGLILTGVKWSDIHVEDQTGER